MLPSWLIYAQAIADVLWKVAAAGIVLIASPKLISTLKTWLEVGTAQIRAERDLERARREAVEADFHRVQALVPMMSQGTAVVREQLDAVAAQYSSLLSAKGKEQQPLDGILLPLITKLMNQGVTAEIGRNNLLIGRRMGQDIWQAFPSVVRAAPDSPEWKLNLAASILVVLPDMNGADLPERLLDSIEQLASLAAEPESLLRSAGSAIGRKVDVVEFLRERIKAGVPMPIATKYVLPYSAA